MSSNPAANFVDEKHQSSAASVAQRRPRNCETEGRVDRRLRTPRRLETIERQLVEETGAAEPTASQVILIKRASQIVLQLEQLDVLAARGKEIDSAHYASLCGTVVRLLDKAQALTPPKKYWTPSKPAPEETIPTPFSDWMDTLSLAGIRLLKEILEAREPGDLSPLSAEQLEAVNNATDPEPPQYDVSSPLDEYIEANKQVHAAWVEQQKAKELEQERARHGLPRKQQSGVLDAIKGLKL